MSVILPSKQGPEGPPGPQGLRVKIRSWLKTVALLCLAAIAIVGGLWSAGIIFESVAPVEPIPFSASPFLESPPQPNYAPDWLDQWFVEQYGHRYYRPIQYKQPEIDELQGLLKEIESHIPFADVYEEDYFDCSEMSAYVEYCLELHGYPAAIFTGSRHAWIMVYTAEGWIPIEVSNLFIPTPTTSENYSIYSQPEDRYDSIGEIWDSVSDQDIAEIVMEGYDWWGTGYADELEEIAEQMAIDPLADQDNDGLTAQEED